MRVQQFLLEIHAAGSLETLRRLIPEGASRLVASDRANFNQFDVAEGQRSMVPSPVPAYWRQLSPVLLAHMHEHILGDPKRAPPLHNAFAFSDRRNDPKWKQCTLYHEYYIPAGARQQLFVHLFQRGTVRWSLAFNRARRDFSAADRAVLELISPHVECAWRNASALDRLRAARHPTVDDGPEQHTVIIDCSARVIASLSLGARRILRKYFGVEPIEGRVVPEELARWLHGQCDRLTSSAAFGGTSQPLCVQREKSSLQVRLVQATPAVAIILLEERTAAVAVRTSSISGITPRENEILHWIREGKRNSEIALILGISPRTVGKHVEHVLEKLGVETRTAAARAAFELAGGKHA